MNGPARPNSLHPLFLQSGEQVSPCLFFSFFLFGLFSMDASFRKSVLGASKGGEARARQGQMVGKKKETETETIQRVLDAIRRGSSRREGRGWQSSVLQAAAQLH